MLKRVCSRLSRVTGAESSPLKGDDPSTPTRNAESSESGMGWLRFSS